jgi:colicin import membrane protein
MIRQHEKSVVWQAGAFTVLVHGMLLALFLVSFQWKTVQPMNVAQVELWDSLPSAHDDTAPPPPPEPAPQSETLKPESPKVIEPAKPEPKVAPVPEPKAEIQTKKTPVTPPKVEKPKADPDAFKKLQQALLAEDAQAPKRDAVKPEASLAGSKTAQVAQAGSPNASEVDKYTGMISNKIKQHVNKQLCGGDRSTRVTFKISLMPTGEVIGHPKFMKGSGMPACDDAIERAILESQPLPVPTSADLFNQFRDLTLDFLPNANN